jgi:hypothetical protein
MVKPAVLPRFGFCRQLCIGIFLYCLAGAKRVQLLAICYKWAPAKSNSTGGIANRPMLAGSSYTAYVAPQGRCQICLLVCYKPLHPAGQAREALLACRKVGVVTMDCEDEIGQQPHVETAGAGVRAGRSQEVPRFCCLLKPLHQLDS